MVDRDIDASIILNLHRGASVLPRTLLSLRNAAVFAKSVGYTLELVVVLDRSDDETHNAVTSFDLSNYDRLQVIHVDNGSLGLSRDSGIEIAGGRFIFTADGDDLLSENYISEILKVAMREERATLFFPEYVLGFGDRYYATKYVGLDDSTPLSFIDAHPYISRFCARRDVFQQVKYSDLRLSSGYAFEDWHFNAEAVAAGIGIRTVPSTILFYRRHEGSLVLAKEAISTRQIPPNPLFVPATFLKVSEPYVEKLRNSETRNKRPAKAKLSESPEVMRMIEDAHAIEPLIDPEKFAPVLISTNQPGSFRVGLSYHTICDAIGERQFAHVYLLPRLLDDPAGKEILSHLEQTYRDDPFQDVLVVLGEEFVNSSLLSRLPPNVVTIDMSLLCRGLPLSARCLITLKLVQTCGSRAPIHLLQSAFTERFMELFGAALQGRDFRHHDNPGTPDDFCATVVRENRIQSDSQPVGCLQPDYDTALEAARPLARADEFDMTKLFYSPPANCQVPELGKVWETLFGRRTEGYFVEVGAYDGENFSNTSCLADAGWAGLYIEPIQEFSDKCRARHAGNPRVFVLNCAASDTAGTARIFIGDTLTTLVGDQVADYEKIDWAKGLHQGESRDVQTARLDTILEEQNAPVGFDVLVIDVEGAEEKVVKGFDIDKWRPKAILIELEDEHPDFRDNTRVVDSVSAIRHAIENAGYQIYFKDHINSLYVRNEVADRAATKAAPADRPPLVSVGLPTFNRPDMLREAVNSILGQTFADFELVISDNCSTDPKVAELCAQWAERDPRITYIRQPLQRSATDNFLAVFRMTSAPLFMWAADDDLWNDAFLEKAVAALDHDDSISAWMCHINVIDPAGLVVREIPNLARFNSSRSKSVDLARFVAHPECLGKANLFYSVFRRAKLATAIEKAQRYFAVWGFDMIFLYAFLCRANIKVDPLIYFSKRLATREVGFLPVDPRQHIVPWEWAGRYYGAIIDVSRGTPYQLFTQAAVRIRYLYDVLYWRFKLKRPAPWRPSQGAPPTV